MEFDRDFSVTINGAGHPVEATFDVVNPATEKVIARAPDCGSAELDLAVAAAREAFPAWKRTPLEDRARLVKEIGTRLADNAAGFAALLTAEQGKPLSGAREEIEGAAYWCNAVADFKLPTITNEDSAGRLSVTHHVPLGVVGAIVPWNYPVLLAIWKIAPALLAGNTVVVKPSPFTPLTMLKLGELARDVLPAGTFNVVSGGDHLGPLMTAHPGINKLSFTGSTATGKKVIESAIPTLKRVTLELGGNDPAIVLPDVDVDSVAEKLFWAAFSNSGQICIATKRLYVHADIYDQMKTALAKIAGSVKMGDGTGEGIQLGPVQNSAQFAKVKNLIEVSRKAGYKFVIGGDVPDAPGYFVPVTIVDNPPESSDVVQLEAFGPVLPMLRFSDIGEAIRRANDTVFGLGASVWSADEDLAREIAAEIEAGTVWINEIQNLSPNSIFGGHKQSGLGVENGIEGLLEYTNPQTISMGRQTS